jgi:hypothetical protein
VLDGKARLRSASGGWLHCKSLLLLLLPIGATIGPPLVWCAARQGEAAYLDSDLRVRRAFFAEGRNIRRRDVLIDIAKEASLNMPDFIQMLDKGEARASVLQESQLERERYKVHGTPTMMLADGTPLRLPIAFPVMRDRKIVGVDALSCCGEGCLDAT